MAIDAVAGATDSEVSTGGVTVKVAEPTMVPEVAVIVEVPAAMLVARPLALTVATEGADDPQVAVLVRFWVVPLL